MGLKRSTVIVLVGIIGIYLAAYAYANTAQPGGTIGFILSPLGVLGACAASTTVYFRVGRARRLGIIWLCFGLAFFFWAAAGAAWALVGLNADEPTGITYPLFALTNVFLLAAVVVFAISQFKRWNRAKLALDAVMFSVTGLLVIWILFFDRSLTIVDFILLEGPFSALSLLTDVIILISVTVWFLSVKSGRIPPFVTLAVIGVTAYVLTDFTYYYLNYHGIYQPNGIVDVAYNASMQLVAMGAAVRMMGGEGVIPTSNLNGPRAGRLAKGAAVVLLPPAAMAIAGFVLAELLWYMAIVVIYKSLSIYFETAIKKEALLEKEKKLNEELGQIVAKHTQNLLDMNEELRRKNEELVFLSNRDTLTNLYNRRYMLDKLERSLSSVKPGQIVALLYIDMDRFKVINDTYGHEMGDRVLLEISKRLKAFAGDHVMLARVGGDEFVCVLTGVTDSQQAAEKARDIIEHCSPNIYIDEYVFSPSLCVGISIYPLDAEDVGTLLKNADIALYHAKEQGVGRFAVFSRMIRQKTQRRNSIEILLRRKDISREFSIHYQPQFSIPDNTLIAAEALIRWRNAELGAIPPSEFIPVAEETDRINDIGLWVLREATAQAAAWNCRYGRDLVIGVNISPKQLNSSKLVEELKSLSDGSGFDPAWLDIEVTESVALEGEYRLAQIFKLFKSIGMSVSIDDFGAGYSSIMSLKQYSFDRIKIAKPMIDAITFDERNAQIVRAIVLMAKSIGMATIAEGVETAAQLAKLCDIGCEQIQGYLLGEPLPAEAFEERFLKPPAGT